MHRRSFLTLGLAGLLCAGAVGVQAKPKPAPRPNAVAVGFIANLDLDAGTFTVQKPRGPKQLRNIAITTTADTQYLGKNHEAIKLEDLTEGDVVQVAGFKQPNHAILATQVSVIAPLDTQHH